MDYQSPQVSLNGKNIISTTGSGDIMPMCSVGVAVMFGMAAVVWNAVAAINVAGLTNYAAAAVGVLSVVAAIAPPADK